MLIVDSHIHLWESRTGPAHHRAEPLGADELIRSMDAAGVDRAVNCPAIWDKRANAIANAAAERYPSRIATMGWIEMAPNGDGASLSDWKKQPGMLGLRFVIVDPAHRAWFDEGALDWIWRAAETYDIPVGLTVPAGMESLRRVAERFPRMRMLIDHMGAGAAGKVPEVFAHMPALLSLAALPNVAVKVSAAAGYATDDYPFRSVHPYLKQLVDAFGPQRAFWGTDITRMAPTYRQCVTMFTEGMPWLGGEDLAEVMGKGLCRWIGWHFS